MEVKKIDDTQITNAIDLIWQTFLQFEAPDYSEEGVKSFQDFIENKEIIKTLEFWGAYDEEELKGVIATNENRKHICCFFVKAQYQRQGIGRELWDFLRENSSSKTITVNSSPYAVPVYHKLGFVDTDTEQLSDGIRYLKIIRTYKITNSLHSRLVFTKIRRLYFCLRRCSLWAKQTTTPCSMTR